MTGMMDFFKKLMDEENNDKENEPGENHDNAPDFMRSFELGQCPFCHEKKLLLALVETLRGIDFVHVCDSCHRAWGLSHDRVSNEFVIVGEIDPEFLPDFLK